MVAPDAKKGRWIAAAVLAVLCGVGGWLHSRAPAPEPAAVKTLPSQDRAVAERATVSAMAPAAPPVQRVVASSGRGPDPESVNRGGRLQGTILDDEERPVADAGVRAQANPGWTGSKETRSAADGTFSLAGLDDGSYTLRARVLRDQEVLRSATAQVQISSGQAPPVTLRFSKQGSLEGIVVDTDGAPIAGATLEVSPVGGEIDSARELHAGPDGRFHASELDGERQTILPQAEGYEPGEPTDARLGDEAIRLVLQRRGRVTGIVIDDATGQPITHFVAGDDVIDSADGHFAVDRFPIEPLTVSAEGFARVSVPTPGDDHTDVTLGRIRLRRGRRIDGVVLDASGRPVSAGQVIASRAGHVLSDPIETAADGTFVLPNMPDRALQLQVETDVAPVFERTVSPVEAHLRIVLSPGASVTGHVQGLPQGVSAQVSAFGLESRTVSVGPDGAYVLGGFSEGRIHLRVDLTRVNGPQPTVHELLRELDLPLGQTVVADFSLGAGVTVHVTQATAPLAVLSSGTASLPLLHDDLKAAIDRGVRARVTAGAVDFRAVPAGPYTVLLLQPGQEDLKVTMLPLRVGNVDVNVSGASASEPISYDDLLLLRE